MIQYSVHSLKTDYIQIGIMNSSIDHTCTWQSEDPHQGGTVNKINLAHRYKNRD